MTVRVNRVDAKLNLGTFSSPNGSLKATFLQMQFFLIKKKKD